MFKAIILFLNSAAQALLEREKNARMRLLTDNARELYEAQVHWYNLVDGGVTGRAVTLAELRVRSLQVFNDKISASAAAPADHAGSLPAKSGTVDLKSGGSVGNATK